MGLAWVMWYPSFNCGGGGGEWGCLAGLGHGAGRGSVLKRFGLHWSAGRRLMEKITSKDRSHEAHCVHIQEKSILRGQQEGSKRTYTEEGTQYIMWDFLFWGGFWVGSWTVWDSLSGEYTGTTICTGVCGEMLQVGDITGAWISQWGLASGDGRNRRKMGHTEGSWRGDARAQGKGQGQGAERGNLQSACGWEQENGKVSPVTSYSLLVMKVKPKEKVKSGWK